MNHEWHKIHDFLYGFGMREIIPDNEIVLEEYNEGIPTRFIKLKQPEKYIWLRDTERWLQIIEIFTMTSEELYLIYGRLQPFMEAERERIRNLPGRTYDKISIPKVNKEYPIC